MADIQNTDSSAATGGILVVLGVILAVGIGFFVFREDIMGNRANPDINIQMPRTEAPAAPSAAPAPATEPAAPVVQ